VKYNQYISDTYTHPIALEGGFYYFSQESTSGSHFAGSQPVEATCREAVESACIFRLTKLPPLTHTLIIEELRSEDTPRGRSRFPHIADPDAGIARRALARPPYPI
jgi:hypothetical protein